MIWVHNLNPYILGPYSFGPISNIGIRWYSLPYICGFMGIYFALRKAALERKVPNGNLDRLEEGALVLILSIIVGGRVGYFVLNQPQSLLSWRGWLEIPQVWHGGMAFFGAALMLFVGEHWYCKKYHLGFWHAADRIMWIFAFALGFGRLANFINGELWGNPTDGSWGVIYPQMPAEQWVNGVNVPRHPYQFYAALSHWLLGFFLLYLLRRKPRTEFDRVPGFTVFWFLGGYGLLRIITDIWRHESIWIIPGVFHGGQALSLLFVILAMLGAHWRVKQLKAKGTPLDWYPEGGVRAELPAECHAFADAEAARLAGLEAGAAPPPPAPEGAGEAGGKGRASAERGSRRR